MDRSKRIVRCNRPLPYIKTKNQRKTKQSKMSNSDGVLQIDLDLEDELLKSDTESAHTNTVKQGDQLVTRKSTVELANNEMMSLLKEIRDSQCTKEDLQNYSRSMNKRLLDMDERVNSNSSSINSMELRLSSLEESFQRSNYEAELLKQNVLSHNLSIMGLPATVDEDLNLLSLKIFQVIGCAIQRSDIFGCYRIKKANKFTSIFIIKFNDFATKQRIMKAKVDKVIKVRDVIGSDTTAGNSTLFINNHVTPFFGKLMAEGRKAVKDKRIQSVWLNRNGCNIRLEANGPERIYRSTDELYRMLSSLDHRSSTSNPFNTGSKRQRSEDDDNSPKNMHRAKKRLSQWWPLRSTLLLWN